MSELWEPLVQFGEDHWLGRRISVGGIWVGSADKPRAVVDLDLPIFLWPMLEKPLVDIFRDLSLHWLELGLSTSSPDDLVRRISVSALESGRDYWEDLALGWVEASLEEGLTGKDLWVGAMVRSTTMLSTQKGRHRAGRLLRRINQPG